MLDKLINLLHDDEIINVEQDNIRLIGFGYGAHLVSAYRK